LTKPLTPEDIKKAGEKAGDNYYREDNELDTSLDTIYGEVTDAHT